VLARLQQAITLGALALALTWAWWATQAGHLTWAVYGVLLVLGGHAAVLGVEFLLLQRAHGDDPAPRAKPAELLAAWWGETMAAPAVFCWRQPFRSQLYENHLPDQAPGSPGVLFIHGFVCNRGLWNPWLKRLRRRGTPFVALNLEPVFGSIDDYIQAIESAVRQLERCTGRPTVIVAHSMGGLALRRWWVEHGNDTRVHRAITIGTPHHGTWLARFAMSRNARQMQQASRWLQTLAAHETVGRAERFTCFYGHCDNIVFPASTATLAGADNRHLPGVAHVHMADRPEPWAELLSWLQPETSESVNI
jgi:pimeloyl-ACP methyl ester carboxylesterase